MKFPVECYSCVSVFVSLHVFVYNRYGLFQITIQVMARVLLIVKQTKLFTVSTLIQCVFNVIAHQNIPTTTVYSVIMTSIEKGQIGCSQWQFRRVATTYTFRVDAIQNRH